MLAATADEAQHTRRSLLDDREIQNGSHPAALVAKLNLRYNRSMATLLTMKGPNPGRQFALGPGATVLGRQSDSTICLESRAVSRHHARIWCLDGVYAIEDLGSSNGTYVNGKRINARVSLGERDLIQLGPYVFAFQPALPPAAPVSSDTEIVIREQISVQSSNWSLYVQDPVQKLQVVLEIAQHLARTLDLDSLLGKLLDHLIRLFPQADRGMVLLCEGDRLMVRAQRARGPDDPTTGSYSRTIVRRALEDGVGILSEDVRSDTQLPLSATLRSLDLRSFLCVPLISQDQHRLGVIQLDCLRPGRSFRSEDLQLLTTIGLQVAVVLENAAMHAELLREERLRQELTLAREIQQGFLPSEFPQGADVGFELFASVYPARQVSGDLYDFFPLADGRLAFLVGDVSGKGMPAALFMVAVRTLCRHVAADGASPAETLAKLNASLAADNPSGMFVTVAHGIYHPATGEVVLASAGHPVPLLRGADGKVNSVPLQPGRLLGYEGGDLHLTDIRLTLDAGDTLILYTDGFTEARAPHGQAMFGIERLQDALGGARTRLPLEACVEEVKALVEEFTGAVELQDDLTLLLLRRVGAGANASP
jgi:serine phosphatase RsbU (regulator of sigma subunit)